MNARTTGMMSLVILLAIAGCKSQNQQTGTNGPPSVVHAAAPAFIEGHPDKRPMTTTATVIKASSINEVDARLRLAVVRWVKPNTGETVSNIIVCQANRSDCMRLNIGEQYTMVWFQHNAMYAVYQTQGYQTVALNKGVYADWARNKEKDNYTQAEYANSMMTVYAVVDLSKANANMREWAMSE